LSDGEEKGSGKKLSQPLDKRDILVLKMTEQIKLESGMPYSAKAVANAFIDLAKKFPNQGNDLTPMKIQKLIYFAHGWHLSLAEKPLIDEQIQAWKFGPVVHSIYRAFRDFGNSPVSSYATEVKVENGRLLTEIPKIPEDSVAMKLVEKIWEVYGKYDGVQLSNATHQSDTPWSKVWEREGKEKLYVGIPDSEIKEYFDTQRKSGAK
jgi:uncharacterized phage-associated protein